MNNANRGAITYVFDVADTPEDVVRSQGADIMGVPQPCGVFVIFRGMPGDEHLLHGHSAQRRGPVFIPVLPVDAGRIVHVLEQLVFVVRLHVIVNRHGAPLLVTPLAASHPDGRVQRPAYVQGPLSFRFLRLIVVRVVCGKKRREKRWSMVCLFVTGKKSGGGQGRWRIVYSGWINRLVARWRRGKLIHGHFGDAVETRCLAAISAAGN